MTIMHKLIAEWSNIADQQLPCELADIAATPAAALACVQSNPDAVIRSLACRDSRWGERIIVQAVLPFLTRISKKMRVDIDDAIAHLWLILPTYPVERRSHLLVSLAWDACKSARQEADTLQPLQQPQPVDVDAETVLRRAYDQGLLSVDLRTLLTKVYIDAEPRALVAAAHHVSEQTLRQRCSRAVRHLHDNRLALVA